MRTVQEALTSCWHQSRNGPAFAKGMCKRETREAYGVASDGSGSATAAWYRTDHRLKVAGKAAPRGALCWWTGGADGNGHVAIADGEGNVWSVDVKRAGYWDLVPFERIGQWSYRLTFAGVSTDIDGVNVAGPFVTPPAGPSTIQALRVTKFANMLNNDRVIDLDILDAIIDHGTPARFTTAAKAAKWALITAARSFLRAVGR